MRKATLVPFSEHRTAGSMGIMAGRQDSLGMPYPVSHLLRATCGFPSSSPQAVTGTDHGRWVSNLKDLYFAPRRNVLLGQHINKTNYRRPLPPLVSREASGCASLPPARASGVFGWQGCQHPPMGSPHVPHGRPQEELFY